MKSYSLSVAPHDDHKSSSCNRPSSYASLKEFIKETVEIVQAYAYMFSKLLKVLWNAVDYFSIVGGLRVPWKVIYSHYECGLGCCFKLIQRIDKISIFRISSNLKTIKYSIFYLCTAYTAICAADIVKL